MHVCVHVMYVVVYVCTIHLEIPLECNQRGGMASAKLPELENVSRGDSSHTWHTIHTERKQWRLLSYSPDMLP